MSFLVAAFAIALGLVLCCAGYRLFGIVLPIFAFFAGFWLAGAAMATIFGQGFLGSLLSIAAGVVLGAVFAVVSFMFRWLALFAAGLVTQLRVSRSYALSVEECSR